MSALPAQLQKSTIVRKQPKAPAWVRGGVRVLAALSPEIAAEAVAPLFFRTRRGLGVRDEDRACFARGARFEVRLGRERLAAWSFGLGPHTVVLGHGWNGHAKQLAPFVDPLVSAGHRVVAFDHVGHGESTGDGTSFPEMADALVAVTEAAGGADAAVTHSLGGAAAILAMRDGLALSRVALIAPPASPIPWLRRFGHALDLDSRTLSATRLSIERRAGRTLEELHVPTLASGLDAQALIFHDRDDREVPISAGEAIHYAWPGSRLVVTAGLGHGRILRSPGVVESVRRFVSGRAD